MNKVYDKVLKFFNQDFDNSLENVIIMTNSDGTYELFNRYTIEQKNETYKIIIKGVIGAKYFSSVRNAVAWCISHKRNKVIAQQKIEELDKKIASYTASINLHHLLIKSTKDINQKSVYYTKLSDEILIRNNLLSEINSYIEETKTWQHKQFTKFK